MMKKSIHHRTNQCYGLHKPPSRSKVTELEAKEIDVIRSRKSQYAIAAWKERMNKMPLALSLILLLMAFVFGCKTSLGPLSQQPPLPYGVIQSKTIVSHQSFVVGPPKPIIVNLEWTMPYITNKPGYYWVYMKSNMNDSVWTLVTNVFVPASSPITNLTVPVITTGTNYWMVSNYYLY